MFIFDKTKAWQSTVEYIRVEIYFGDKYKE